MTMSVFVYDAVDTVMYGTKKIYVMFSLKCMSSGQKIIRESLCRSILSGPLGNGRLETAGG